MLYRLVLISLLISVPVFAADPLELDVQGLTNGRVSTKKTDGVVVVATNRGSETPLVFLWIEVEKRGVDGKFYNFRVDILCSCGAKCKRAPFCLKKDESMRGTWNFLSNDCQKAPLGVYRFAVTGHYSDAISGYVYLGVSKEFTVIE